MKFMNEYDIEDAVRKFDADPVLGPAARFLDAYKNEVNAHSDGWPYWSAPVKAAGKLIELLDGHRMSGMGAYPRLPRPTEADIKRTLTPIKVFMTKRGTAVGMVFPELR